MTVQNLLNGIGSLAIKTGNGGDIGGYIFDKVDDGISIINNDNLNFGTGDFSIEVYFQVNDVSGVQTLINKGTLGSGQGYSLYLNFTSGNVILNLTDSVTGEGNFALFPTSTILINTPYHLVVVGDRDGNANAYLNGVLTGSAADISTYSGTVSTAYSLYIGKNFVSGYFGGRIFLTRFYNRVLTATEIASIYDNGRPDLYELPYLLKGANNTNLITNGTFTDPATEWTAGTGWTISGGKASCDGSEASSNLTCACVITLNKCYRVTYTVSDYVSGSVVVNLGGYTGGTSRSADGTYTEDITLSDPATVNNFFIVAQNFNGSVDNVSCVEVGSVAEYLPHNAGSLGWIESSGNQLSGSTSGSPICLNKENRPPHYRDIRKAIAANTDTTLTSIVPKGYKIVSIRAKGSDSLADIKIGSASAGEQIVAATTTSSTTPKLLTLASTANDAYSESADVTLYARHDTSASGKTMDLIFHFEKVGN